MGHAIQHLEEIALEPRLSAKVISSQRITPADTPEVRELVLELDRTDLEATVGKNVGVLAPADPTFGHRHHLRLYSIADLPERGPDGTVRIKICVRRCFYVDDYSGERYPGVASNYLCDLCPGDSLSLTGPHEAPFQIPSDPEANLVLIGTGTGIAPFRALVKHLYRDAPGWQGKVLLFYGARSGLELLYMNDEVDDFAQYYDEETFRAFKALSPRPHWDDPIAWDQAISQRGSEVLQLLAQDNTYVYVAGLESLRPHLDAVFATLLGSKEAWHERQAELAERGRWVELLY